MNADLIVKIQRLRALAQSTNVHEAANAAAAAERLIAEHQLTEADLETGNGTKPEDVEAWADPLFVHDGVRIYWKEWLAKDLAALYSVVTSCAWCTGDAANSKIGFKVIGAKSDVELLRYQFAFLTSENRTPRPALPQGEHLRARRREDGREPIPHRRGRRRHQRDESRALLSS